MTIFFLRMEQGPPVRQPGPVRGRRHPARQEQNWAYYPDRWSRKKPNKLGFIFFLIVIGTNHWDRFLNYHLLPVFCHKNFEQSLIFIVKLLVKNSKKALANIQAPHPMYLMVKNASAAQEFFLLYKGFFPDKSGIRLFSDIQENFTLYIRLHILLLLI